MPNILIVDDQPCVLELISQELMNDGHQVDGFTAAESVMRHLRSSRPDLVLLEPFLHGHDGWELLRHIKKQAPDLPVLIVTARKSFLDDPRAYLADGCFTKSFDFSKLKQKVAALLNRQQDPQVTPKARSHAPEVALADGF